MLKDRMIKSEPRAAFQGKGQFLLIAALPVAFLLAKYALWGTYGIFDFHTFHLAGVLANAGQSEHLYQPDYFMSQFKPTYGAPGALPWFYPPILLPYCQFLALFSAPVAYLVNGFLSLAVYYLVIFWLFPGSYREIITLSALPLILPLGFGHPVILLLSLLFVGYHFAKPSLWKALLALTLCAAKPHLGGIAGLLVFIRSPRQALLPSTLIFIGVIAVFSMLYGWEIWELFAQSIGAASSYLGSGMINQQWISSVYGAALSLGATNTSAILAHVAVLLFAIGASLYLFRNTPAKRFWVATGMAVVFTTPYLMYYDLIYLLFPLSLVVSTLNKVKARNWVYTVFIGELGMVALLGLETASAMGFIGFCGFAAAILYGQAKYA